MVVYWSISLKQVLNGVSMGIMSELLMKVTQDVSEGLERVGLKYR